MAQDRESRLRRDRGGRRARRIHAGGAGRHAGPPGAAAGEGDLPALPDRRVAAAVDGARRLPPARRRRRAGARPASPRNGAVRSVGRQPGAVDVLVLRLAEDGRADLVRLPGRADEVRPDPARQRPAHGRRRPRGVRGRRRRSRTAAGSRGVRYTDADGGRAARSAPGTWSTPRATRAASTSRSAATRQYSEFFRNLALFGYFEGGKRLPAPNSGNILSRRLRQRLVLVHPAERRPDQRRRGGPAGHGRQDPGRPGGGARRR